jgi:hypothetical protein
MLLFYCRLLDRIIGIKANELIGEYDVNNLVTDGVELQYVSLFIDTCPNYNPDCEGPPCGGWANDEIKSQNGICNTGVPGFYGGTCGYLGDASSWGVQPMNMCWQCSYCQPCDPPADGYSFATACGSSSGKNCVG